MASEFTCAECGQHVVKMIPLTPTEPPLCAICIVSPGWFEDPELCRIFDPTNLRRPPVFPTGVKV